MSTAAVARPSQALRQRSQRPSLARTNVPKASTLEDTASKPGEVRFVWTQDDILAKFKGRNPSLRVHLYATHFRLNDSQESLSYGSPMTLLLQHIRFKTVPHSMLEELYMFDIPFYDGIVSSPNDISISLYSVQVA